MVKKVLVEAIVKRKNNKQLLPSSNSALIEAKHCHTSSCASICLVCFLWINLAIAVIELTCRGESRERGSNIRRVESSEARGSFSFLTAQYSTFSRQRDELFVLRLS
jgi:hypothetical protein